MNKHFLSRLTIASLVSFVGTYAGNVVAYAVTYNLYVESRYSEYFGPKYIFAFSIVANMCLLVVFYSPGILAATRIGVLRKLRSPYLGVGIFLYFCVVAFLNQFDLTTPYFGTVGGYLANTIAGLVICVLLSYFSPKVLSK